MRLITIKLVILLSLLSIFSACSQNESSSPIIFEEGTSLLTLEEESKEVIYESLDQQNYYDGDEGLAPAELSQSIPLASEEEYHDMIEKSYIQPRIIYFGFEECPYCKSFIPKLNQLAEEAEVYYYYYDTEQRVDDSNFDSVMKHFDLHTVPLALMIDEDHVVSKVDHQSSMKEIEEFILSVPPYE